MFIWGDFFPGGDSIVPVCSNGIKNREFFPFVVSGLVSLYWGKLDFFHGKLVANQLFWFGCMGVVWPVGMGV